jgi:hypothetical protein
MLVYRIQHGTELHHLEGLAVFAGAGLSEKYWGTKFSADLNRNRRDNRGKYDQP